MPGLREQLELAAQLGTPTKSNAHKRADSRPTSAGFGYEASADGGHPDVKVVEKSYAARLQDIDKIMGNDGTEESDSGKFIFIKSSIV